MRTNFWNLPIVFVMLLAVGCGNKGGDASPAGTTPTGDVSKPAPPEPIPGPNTIQSLSKTQISNLWMNLYSAKGANRLRNITLSSFYLELDLEKLGVVVDESNYKSFEKLLSFLVDTEGHKFEQLEDLDKIKESL